MRARSIAAVFLICIGVGSVVAIGRSTLDAELETPASLVRLIADPTRADGKPVLVHGFLSRSSGIQMLYLTQSHAFMADATSGYAVIGVELDACLDSYVALSATFGKSSRNDWEYLFTGVERVVAFPSHGEVKVCFRGTEHQE